MSEFIFNDFERIPQQPLVAYYFATVFDGDAIYATTLVFNELHRRRLGEMELEKEARRVALKRLSGEDREKYRIRSISDGVEIALRDNAEGNPAWFSE